MIKLEFSANTMDELRGAVRSFLGQYEMPDPKANPDPAPAFQPEPTNKPDDAPKAPEAKRYEIEEIRKMMGELIARKGKQAGKAILAKLGVPNVTSLPADRYPEFVEMLEAE